MRGNVGKLLKTEKINRNGRKGAEDREKNEDKKKERKNKEISGSLLYGSEQPAVC
jgi:hypothetical protein